MYVNFVEEKKLWKKGFKRVAGLDEAGRGPLAGPIVAGVVIINPKHEARNSKQIQKPNFLNSKPVSDFEFRISDLKLRDSKQLSAKRREAFYKIFTTHPRVWWGIGIVSEKIIDRINIKNAAELAMEKAVNNLKIKPDFLIIDGNNVKNYQLKTINYKLIIKADEKVFSCAAASILAKVTRDRLMLKYHQQYPQYGFAQHKGYPTKLHRARLNKYGRCAIHRNSFHYRASV